MQAHDRGTNCLSKISPCCMRGICKTNWIARGVASPRAITVLCLLWSALSGMVTCLMPTAPAHLAVS